MSQADVKFSSLNQLGYGASGKRLRQLLREVGLWQRFKECESQFRIQGFKIAEAKACAMEMLWHGELGTIDRERLLEVFGWPRPAEGYAFAPRPGQLKALSWLYGRMGWELSGGLLERLGFGELLGERLALDAEAAQGRTLVGEPSRRRESSEAEESQPKSRRWRAPSSNKREVVEWVASALAQPGAVSIRSAPCAEAWGLYKWASADESHESEFWKAMYSKLLPTRSQVEVENSYRDDGRRKLETLERVLRSLREAEAEAEPVGLDADDDSGGGDALNGGCDGDQDGESEAA